mmetsp:Transcript_18168/g.40026  ORF Transcript_18168/g.40026 Transcript_18168/m.40026 type:complete len:220 (-) Transcript_18168:542-1201(-)
MTGKDLRFSLCSCKPAFSAKSSHFRGFLWISNQASWNKSRKLAMCTKNASLAFGSACALSEMEKYFCDSQQALKASSPASCRSSFSFTHSLITRRSSASLSSPISNSGSSSSSSISNCRLAISTSLAKASMDPLSKTNFSFEASCTCDIDTFRSWKKLKSFDIKERHKKCMVETAPVLKDAKEDNDSTLMPRMAPSTISFTPWLMKLPTFSTTPSISRN